MSVGEKVKVRGSKRQVWNGSAKKTAGGLERKDLVQKPDGRIVSRRKSEQGKKLFTRNPQIRASFKAHQFHAGRKPSRKHSGMY